MEQFVKVFNYQIVGEKSLNKLEQFKNHRRLKVFYSKGTTCVTCGKIGTRLIKGYGRGRHHWDVYTDDLYPLTVDHIIPKSLGGCDELDNLQPMCAGCNFRKGNGHPYVDKNKPWIPKGFCKCSLLEDLNVLFGKEVYKRKVDSKRKLKKIYKLGIIEDIFLGKNLRDHYAKIQDKPDHENGYNLKLLFVSQTELVTDTLTQSS
jgi:hypothetical protein